MVWTVLALALWVVLGGFISYYGDLQGRRWGKRRVSWFGMRPKHTAILITSLTGGFIALFSVASLMIIVPTVRDVVTHGENAIQENKRLIAEEKQQQLMDKLDREREVRENRLKLQATEMKLQATDKRYIDGQRSLAELQSRIAPLKARADLLNARVQALQIQETNLANRNRGLETDIASAGVINKQLAAQNIDFGHQNGDLGKTNHSLVAANNTLKQENSTLLQTRQRYMANNDSWYNSNISLETQKSVLEKQNSALAKEKHELEVQLADLAHQREEVIDLIRQRDQLTSQIAQQYRVLLQGHVVLGAGVELARLSMDAHLRPEAIKNQVGALIATASEQAKRFGAVAGENGQAAILLPQQKVTLTGYENRDQNAQVDSLSDEWSGSDTSYVVVASTVTNCLAGEPANIELHRYPVVRVFAKGAEVASRTIDGHSKVDDIIKNLMAFLQKDVQKSALQAGIIPRVDPETGLSEVGVLGTGELFHLTDTVRRMRGPVLLTARAKQNVSSADRLDLDFKVSRLPSPSTSIATDY